MYKEVLVKPLNINVNASASGGSPILPFGHTDVWMNRYDGSYDDPQSCIEQLDMISKPTNAHKCMKVFYIHRGVPHR